MNKSQETALAELVSNIDSLTKRVSSAVTRTMSRNTLAAILMTLYEPDRLDHMTCWDFVEFADRPDGGTAVILNLPCQAESTVEIQIALIEKLDGYASTTSDTHVVVAPLVLETNEPT